MDRDNPRLAREQDFPTAIPRNQNNYNAPPRFFLVGKGIGGLGYPTLS
ncbi:MAG: hypothetical protein QNJ74_09155 [Trichodesmium sp. MO_231.B1]|nr:hypothetical protein [Trichodesmium sp. MO_231.B1]